MFTIWTHPETVPEWSVSRDINYPFAILCVGDYYAGLINRYHN